MAEIHTIEAHYLADRLRHDIDRLTSLATRIDIDELTGPHPSTAGE